MSWEPAVNARQAPAVAVFQEQALLDPVTLEAILELNLDFLTLVEARHRREPARPCVGFSHTLAMRLSGLSVSARRRLAACPYTLFDMRFGDVAFWRAGTIPTGGAGAPDELPIAIGFAQVAAFFAWHVSRGDALTAALVLGLEPSAHAAWRALPLAALPGRAGLALASLTARFGDCPHFWDALVADAVSARRGRIGDPRLQGLQLLAARRVAAVRPPRARA
jgi:hypothetical protein